MSDVLTYFFYETLQSLKSFTESNFGFTQFAKLIISNLTHSFIMLSLVELKHEKASFIMHDDESFHPCVGVQNPSDSNEIIVFCERLSDVYVYRKDTNKYEKFAIYPTAGDPENMRVVHISNSNHFIVVYQVGNKSKCIYSIFNPEKQAFEFLETVDKHNYSRLTRHNIDEKRIHGGSALNVYKNYLFISGGDTHANEIDIFDISNVKSPKFITTIEIDIFSYYSNHAAIIVPKHWTKNTSNVDIDINVRNSENVKDKENEKEMGLEKCKDDSIIDLILFGRDDCEFTESFCCIAIDTDKLSQLKTETSSETENSSSGHDQIDKNKAYSIDYSPKSWLDGLKMNISDVDDFEAKKNADDDKDNDKDNEKDNIDIMEVKEKKIFAKLNLYSYEKFSYHVYGSRYLILIGGNIGDREILDSIIYYDIQCESWHLFDYKLPYPLQKHTSVLCYDSNISNNYLILCVMGGIKTLFETYRVVHDDVPAQGNILNYTSWKFGVLEDIHWEIERLVWIGYFKNEINTKDMEDKDIETDCGFGKLPKDVILHIFKFLRKKDLFTRAP